MTTGWPDPPRVTWWSGLWRRFWVLPVAIAVVSLAFGILLPALDASLEHSPAWVFQGGVDGARSLLGSIASAMISVTGLVFSITMVVLQLASSQFSPRVQRSFLQSRVVQLTLGFFTGSFVYTLTVLRAVRGGDDGRVPQVAVTASYLYVVVAVGMFLAFIHHITNLVQVTHVMADVRRRTVATAERLAPDGDPGDAPSPELDGTSAPFLNGPNCGYLVSLDSAPLISVARRLNAVVQIDIAPGDHIAPGQVIGRIWGTAALSEQDQDELQASVALSKDRDIAADAGFGVRQLLDIAERALSPGINDPTTAIQAINELHVVFRAMAQLRDPSATLLRDGRVVAAYPAQRYAELLRAAVAELCEHGGANSRVMGRVRDVLGELRAVARPEHEAATRAALAMLEARDDQRIHPAEPPDPPSSEFGWRPIA